MGSNGAIVLLVWMETNNDIEKEKKKHELFKTSYDNCTFHKSAVVKLRKKSCLVLCGLSGSDKVGVENALSLCTRLCLVCIS